ncbi:MAG: hypothetical protein HY870_18555 [Chloroflexi bacterium]|nr:hypothetical protein [Chloroflexota bacterium]
MTQLTLRSRSMLTAWLALLATLVLLTSFAASALAAGQWTATNAMVNSHMWHAAALLADGRVLATGGPTGFFSAAAEIFNPATGSWTATGSMTVSRALHTATTLNDGRVLVAGGVDNTIYTNVTYASAEIFDPATGTWTLTGSMTMARSQHTATRLNDGRVLVVGGVTAEIYNPTTGLWITTSNPGITHGGHTATLLSDGRVLVAGGLGSSANAVSTVEIYDPTTDTWITTGSLSSARWDHAAALLNDGRVLVAGGRADSGGNFIPLASTEIYDPVTGIWTATGNLGTTRAFHTATLLSDGQVLAVGGLTNGAVLSTAEIFDPATGGWSATGSMIDSRGDHTATRLNDGRVLAVGGGGNGSGTCCAELFTLTPGGVTPTPTPPPPASITVIAPNGGEVWRIGSTQTIQWTATSVTGNVRILLSRDGGASYKQIATHVSNTGAFQWTVTKPAATGALIRVISINQSSVLDTSDAVFSIRR